MGGLLIGQIAAWRRPEQDDMYQLRDTVLGHVEEHLQVTSGREHSGFRYARMDRDRLPVPGARSTWD